MLKVNNESLDWIEKQYPGIKTQIITFEQAKLPNCQNCGSSDTADVQVGIVGRSIYIASATTKFKLIANGPKPGNFYCNICEKYFR
jgi:hypothetical protein